MTKKRRKKAGLAPGTIVYTGSKTTDKVHTHYLEYNADKLMEKTLDSHSGLELGMDSEQTVDWYDIRGMHDVELIETLGHVFTIHPLILENAVDIYQRPKFEEYERGNFVVLKALSFDKESRQVKKEHIALYFTSSCLISLQETASDVFESVRNRINSGKGRIRERGTDYLAYALIDTLVDNYFSVMDEVEEVIEQLEDKLTTSVEINSKGEIHALKKELLVLRKAVAPLREAVAQFYKSDSEIIKESSRMYLRDVYEHTIQIIDTVESYRDVLNGLQDLMITEVSFKMNKVMQLLTLVSTIFIPLTFLAGIYGMNFENMPELNYKYGYYVLLGVMAVMFIALVVLFKRKKWFPS